MVKFSIANVDVRANTVTVITAPCIMCHETTSLPNMPLGHIRALIEGGFVQSVFPKMSADQRELLISGTHPKCWDEIFADMEE